MIRHTHGHVFSSRWPSEPYELSICKRGFIAHYPCLHTRFPLQPSELLLTSNKIKNLKVIMKCPLQPRYYTTSSTSREICKDEECVCPPPCTLSVGKMKTINTGRKTLPNKQHVTVVQFEKRALERLLPPVWCDEAVIHISFTSFFKPNTIISAGNMWRQGL